MKGVINNRNKNILGTTMSINTCNCQNAACKKAFPLNGQCQIREVVYEGTLSSNQLNYNEKK